MKNKENEIIGRECFHGSPGYPVKETIQTITFDAKKDLFAIVFESGCYTHLSKAEFENLGENGRVCYNPWKCYTTRRSGMLEEMMLL